MNRSSTALRHLPLALAGLILSVGGAIPASTMPSRNSRSSAFAASRNTSTPLRETIEISHAVETTNAICEALNGGAQFPRGADEMKLADPMAQLWETRTRSRFFAFRGVGSPDANKTACMASVKEGDSGYRPERVTVSQGDQAIIVELERPDCELGYVVSRRATDPERIVFSNHYLDADDNPRVLRHESDLPAWRQQVGIPNRRMASHGEMFGYLQRGESSWRVYLQILTANNKVETLANSERQGADWVNSHVIEAPVARVWRGAAHPHMTPAFLAEAYVLIHSALTTDLY